MIKFALAAALAVGVPAIAAAQDTTPDGSRPFGIEPYVGVLGGYHSFDTKSELGANARYGKADGALDAILAPRK